MMNKKEFTETIMVRLAERCPDFSFETTNVIKRNDEKLIGIIGRTPHALCPTVYVEPFYQNYRQGMSADEVIDRMAEIFWQEHLSVKSELSIRNNMEDFEKIKDRLIIVLSSLDMNEQWLKDKCYRPFLNLAATVGILVDVDETSNSIIHVQEKMLDMWNVTFEYIFEVAKENSFIESNILFKDIYDVLTLDGISLDADASLLYVATNRHNFMGANLLMNNSFLYEIAEKLQDSFYIIPSSVHELLVLPACQVQDVEGLNRLIQNINDTEVILSDRLSYTLYYYDCTTHKVSIAY